MVGGGRTSSYWFSASRPRDCGNTPGSSATKPADPHTRPSERSVTSGGSPYKDVFDLTSQQAPTPLTESTTLNIQLRKIDCLFLKRNKWWYVPSFPLTSTVTNRIFFLQILKSHNTRKSFIGMQILRAVLLWRFRSIKFGPAYFIQ